MSARIKVLVIDDSAVVRQTFAAMLGEEPDLEVIGTAGDAFEAAALMRSVRPDAIVLDVEMPRMDGLTFLQKIMAQHPIPVVVCSSLAQAGSRTAFQAFELGAVEVIAKPTGGRSDHLAEARIQLCDAVRAAARSGGSRPGGRPRLAPVVSVQRNARTSTPGGPSQRVIVVGASTGGTEALPRLLAGLPADAPGLAVVQHMPEYFTALFAERLDGLGPLEVREARNGDPILDGRVLIAPGGRHMMLRRGTAGYFVEIRDGPLVSRHRPSVDVLFHSAAQAAGADAVGVIMTGMGDDGARGMCALRAAGARTFAQDEASCVVYGMPREAVARGGVDQTVELGRLADAVLQASGWSGRKLR